MAYPGTHAYMFRRTYNELRDTLINEARASIPLALGRYVESRKELNLINGSVIHFRHCQEDGDRFQYQGAEIHWLYIDELTHFSQVVYDFLKTRLRANKALGIRPVVRCTSNPGGVGHAWVKAYFVDAAPPGEIIEERVWSEELKRERVVTRQYIPARATDNPHISSDYIYELEKKPKNLRDALLLGKWDAFEGQVFVEWRDNPDGYVSRKYSHVLKPFPIPRTWLIYRSFDFGYPLLSRCCRPVTVCNIRSRTRYAVVVETTPTSGVFRLIGNTTCCGPNNNLPSINGVAPAPAAASVAVAEKDGV